MSAAWTRGAMAAMLSLFALACGGYTEVHQVVLRVPPGPTGRDPQFYLGDQVPPNPFYELALIQVMGHDGDANPEDVVAAMREHSRTLGCDAVIRVRVDRGYTMAHGYGICVKWATASPPPQPARL